MQGGLAFGTAGVPVSSRAPTTEAGIERVAELGLGCMEVEFVQGVRMGEKSAREVGAVALRLGIRLTAHGPYFINLNSREDDKVRASRERILQTARVTHMFGGEGIVFHAAFYMGDPPSQVYQVVKRHLQEIVAQLRAEGINLWVRPEVTGKPTQFGTLEEALRLSAEVEGVAPCVDFAHWHARMGGGFNSYQDFVDIIRQVEAALGKPGLRNMAIHVSGVAYGKKGETKHLVLQESDFQYRDFVRALRDCDVGALVICESPNLEEDALLLQSEFRALSEE